MGTKQYDSATDLITFSRASSATFLGSNGLLQTAANNIPRIEYDATGAVKGLLIEEARTNNLKSSGDLNGSGWVAAATIGTLTAGSPFGTYQTISPAYNSTGIGPAQRYQIGRAITSGATYVAWSLVKYSAGSGWFIVNPYDTTSGNKRAYFDVQNGVVGVKDATLLDHGMVDYGDGWWLCWVSANAASTSGGVSCEAPNGDGVLSCTASDVILIAGTQFEQGSFPTSYIPTTSAAATRAKDLAEIPTSAFGYNNDKGSLVIDVLTPVADQFMILAYFNTSSYFNSRGLAKSNFNNNSVGPYYVLAAYDGSSTKLVLEQQTQAVYTKLGLSYGDSERAVRDGGTVFSGASRSTNPTRLHLGGRENGLQSQCWIKSIQYYPRQLTDTQLQEITAAGSSLRAYALGNSTVGPYSGQPSVISLVTTSNIKVNVAVPGDTIAEQKADWNSLPVNSLGTAWVVLQVGLNDLNPAVGTTASKIAEIQDLVDTIKADIGSKPLYVAKMLPCKQRLVDVYGATAAASQQRWVDMNEAIAGNGSSPITGVQGRIVSHVPLMDDGFGNLKAVYDLGDHIHPNTAGRQVMATAWEGFTT